MGFISTCPLLILLFTSHSFSDNTGLYIFIMVINLQVTIKDKLYVEFWPGMQIAKHF